MELAIGFPRSADCRSAHPIVSCGKLFRFAAKTTITSCSPVLCIISLRVSVFYTVSRHSSVMLQELSHMDRITQLQDEIQQVRMQSLCR